MTFWEKWVEWWTGVSAQWNAIDARIQAGDVQLTEEQQVQYQAYSDAFDAIEASLRNGDLEDLAELKLAGQADELAAAALDAAGGLAQSALNWIDSLF